MSEPILIALVQLFAIVAASRRDKNSENTRLIIATYLKQYINGKELEEYLLLYDELHSFHSLDDDEPDDTPSEILDKIEKIGTKISKGLQQKDKILIYIKFIEFIEEICKDNCYKDGAGITNMEYYKIICSSFSLTENENNTIINFLLNPFCIDVHTENMLAVVAKSGDEKFPFKTIARERLNGKILILHLDSVGLFICRYLGNDDLYLNGHYINPNHSFILNSGSIIRGQKIEPVYYTDMAAQMLQFEQNIQIQLNAVDIGFTFSDSNNGIQPFSFSAQSGELIGIMGGSGAGKSTLLSLLNGTRNLHQGHIFINGHDLETENEELKKVIGYIPQDDLLIDELTVFQNLYFNAQLCFSNYSPYRLMRIILKILHDVDLMGIRKLVVGNVLNKVISGGQRKRLNIALELLREPYILFADEPTSGLSSMDSEMVMLLLKEQTLKGRLVMVNIHQPSSDIFKLFDKLLILDKGGFPIFYGNPIDSITYFKSESRHVNPSESECLTCGYVNPEQLFEITEAKTIDKHGKVTNQRILRPIDWYHIFKKKIQPGLRIETRQEAIPVNHFKKPNPFAQFKIFSIRNLYIKLTNKQYVLLNLLEAPFLAVILAYLTRYSPNETYTFSQNKNLIAYLFMSVVVALFLGMMVSAEEIIKDRKLLKREAYLTLSRLSYLNSKVLYLFTLSAIQTFLYVIIGNYILGIQHLNFSYWLILFTTSCFANMVGLNLSSGLNSVVNIYILIPFFLVPQILLSGAIVPFNSLNRSISSSKNVPIVGDLMASRWAFEALAVNQFIDNDYSKYFYACDKQLSNYDFYSSSFIPALQSKVDESYRNIVIANKLDETKENLCLIQNEITKLETKENIKHWNQLNLISIDHLNEQNRLYIKNHLDSMVVYFAIKRGVISKQRDLVYDSLVKAMGSDGVFILKQKNYNQSLEDWILNRRDLQAVTFENHGFIRKKDPVYMDPESKNGRAHFYAPIKFLGQYFIETLWFNIVIIWLMSLVLYIVLLNDSLRKIIAYIEHKKANKKRLKRLSAG